MSFYAEIAATESLDERAKVLTEGLQYLLGVERIDLVVSRDEQELCDTHTKIKAPKEKFVYEPATNTSSRQVMIILTAYSNTPFDNNKKRLIDQHAKVAYALLEPLASLSFEQALGIYNKSAGLDIIEKECKRAQRYNSPLTIVMADIDHFSRVNNTYGHLCGDTVLKEISKIFKSNLREQDFIFRYGGEEFGIIQPHTNLESAIVVAERVRINIEQHKFMYENEPIHITTSFGIAQYTPGKTPKEVIEEADHQLYEAKTAGRNCIRPTLDAL